jgi:hypothetical protein
VAESRKISLMLDVLGIKAGDLLKLRGDFFAEVVENMGDGEWLRVRVVALRDQAVQAGDEELCHYSDILGTAEPAPRKPDARGQPQ